MALTEIQRKYSPYGDQSWRTAFKRNGEQHVYPPGDDTVHRLSGADECVCMPVERLVTCECCGDQMIIEHNAFDGRSRWPGLDEFDRG